MKPINKILRAEEILIDDNKNKIVNFIFIFIKCEIYCKSILKEYLKEINEYESDEDIKLELGKIKEALSDNGYFFEDTKLLTRIFGNDRSSCVYLRNKIVHELSVASINHVLVRYEALISDMNIFINTLSNNL